MIIAKSSTKIFHQKKTNKKNCHFGLMVVALHELHRFVHNLMIMFSSIIGDDSKNILNLESNIWHF